MRVDGHVSSGSGERLSLSVRDMLLRLRVTVLLSHTEVDNMNDIGAFRAGSANEEVVGLDVSVDQVLFGEWSVLLRAAGIC